MEELALLTAVVAGVGYLLWRYSEGNRSPKTMQHGSKRPAGIANSINEDTVATLRGLRDQETNLIRYCVFDRALLGISEDGTENSAEYERDTEVIQNPHDYAGHTRTDYSLHYASRRARTRRGCVKPTPQQIETEISLLNSLARDKSNPILRSVYERAMHEREQQLRGQHGICNNRSSNNYSYVLQYPHEFISQD